MSSKSKNFKKVIILVTAFIVVCVLAFSWETDLREERAERAAEYKAMQERARAAQGTTGIREEIIGTVTDYDWEGFAERTVRQTQEEATEVFGYTEKITEDIERGANKGYEN